MADTNSLEELWRNAQEAREQSPQDPNLRNLEHYLVSKLLIQQMPPGLGRAAALILPPGYAATKWGAQNLPGELGAIPRGLGRLLLGQDLTQATPPSWDEIKWGMKPAFER